MSFVVGALLPYITIIIFAGGMIYQINKWRTLASPAMTLTPAPESSRERLVEALQGAFLFRNLFNSDKFLWLISWSFHAVLAISLIVHYDRILAFMGITSGSILKMPSVILDLIGVIILITAGFLLIRRFALKRVAEISSADDYFALILILGVVVTGDALRFMSHLDVIQIREYFSGLITFSFKALPENNWFIAHYLLAQVLIIYVPFSKILHLGGIFFTQAAIRKH